MPSGLEGTWCRNIARAVDRGLQGLFLRGGVDKFEEGVADTREPHDAMSSIRHYGMDGLATQQAGNSVAVMRWSDWVRSTRQNCNRCGSRSD